MPFMTPPFFRCRRAEAFASHRQIVVLPRRHLDVLVLQHRQRALFYYADCVNLSATRRRVECGMMTSSIVPRSAAI
jgi:hypothetical protein